MSSETDVARDDDIAAAEALLRTYLDLWNAGDIAPIWAGCYVREGAILPWDQPGMTAARTWLTEQGFTHSRQDALTAQAIAPGHVEIRLRFTRMGPGEVPIPPGTRESLYVLRCRPEGWRITEMHPVI